MRKILKHLAIRFGRIYPTSLTKRSEVAELIQRLYPINTGIEFIRLGPEGDGGYLVPNDFTGIEACFSPGVGTISGFDEDCADLGMTVFLADGTIEKPTVMNDRFKFIKKYIGATTNDNFITIDDWVYSSISSKDDLILQMDIEGFEYEALLSVSDNLIKRFRIIIVEFHGLNQFWNKPFFKIARQVFLKILRTHTCIHIHPNNSNGSFRNFGLEIPKSMEFTFLRNDRFISKGFADTFPHPLDHDNIKRPTIVLPKCWYKH